MRELAHLVFHCGEVSDALHATERIHSFIHEACYWKPVTYRYLICVCPVHPIHPVRVQLVLEARDSTAQGGGGGGGAYQANPKLSITRIGSRAFPRALDTLAPQIRLGLAQADDARRCGVSRLCVCVCVWGGGLVVAGARNALCRLFCAPALASLPLPSTIHTAFHRCVVHDRVTHHVPVR
jgi:hypothetical protein